MSKKILIGFAPLLAVAAFAVMPAMASATTAYGICKTGVPHTSNCPAGQGFVAFANGKAEKVLSKLAPEETFVLVDEVTGGTITCTTFSDAGTVTNEGGVGHSSLTLKFDDCTITAFPPEPAVVGCSVKTPGAASDVIEGTVTDEVTSETTVKVTVTGGFKLETDGTPVGCPSGVQLGTVKGHATGTVAVGSNDLVFNKATGLELGTDAANITGSDETVTEVGANRVLIN